MPIVYTDLSGIDIIKRNLSHDVWVWRKPISEFTHNMPVYISTKHLASPNEVDRDGNLNINIQFCHLSFSNKLLHINK